MPQGAAGRQRAAGGRAGGAAGDPVYSGFLRTLLMCSSRLMGHTCVSLSVPGKSSLFTKRGLHTVLPNRPLRNPRSSSPGAPCRAQAGIPLCLPPLPHPQGQDPGTHATLPCSRPAAQPKYEQEAQGEANASSVYVVQG